ncbi:putative NAD dependent epimerase/dehydratase [Xylariaceae sp. AK1471]|nr:putative NAD dependent epimerase/dehydratase [Xylariaceae sp. AK1471]
MSPTIFVVAATGTIGKALALDLIKIGWNVHTTTRNLASPAAKELASAGVKVFPGDWDNQDVLRDAMAGCDGLFLNLMPSFTDLEADARQGKNILAIAKAAGVKHAIHSSGVGVNTPELFDNYKPDGLLAQFLGNKKTVEDATRAAGFEAYTILRPASFMANWLAPKVFMYSGLVDTGTFTTAFRPDTVIASIDEHDLAALSIAAFKDPTKFHQQEIEVASEKHTVQEILETLSEATGRQLKGHYLTDEEILVKIKENPFLEGQFVSRNLFRFINMNEVKKWGVPLHTLKEYLKREKASVEQTYNQSR